MLLNEKLGRCGVYCGQCKAFHRDVAKAASDFRKWILDDFSWMKDEKDVFDYENLIKALDHFATLEACSCRIQTDVWCDVKKCPKIQQDKIDNCLLCDEFDVCEHTDYQRNRYSYLFDQRKDIHEKGFDAFLEEQELIAQNGVRLHDIRDY